MTPRERIRQHLAELVGERVADGESLVLSGRLQSVAVVETLVFLEEAFGFSMEPADFHASKFDSVNSILALLESSRA